MTTRGSAVLFRLVAVLGIAAVGFVVLQGPARRLEAKSAVAVLRAAGTSGVFAASGTSVLVVPRSHPAFQAVVTPTCSAIASILAISCLAFLAHNRRGSQRLRALAAALAVIAAGNVLRIAASIGVGLVAGRTSLILFHDWVGSAFGFAYTLGGYVLFLYLLLPARRADSERASWSLPSNSSSLVAVPYSSSLR